MNNHKKQEQAYEKALSDWLETFKGENVPEEKRITDFRIDSLGWGISELDENRQKVNFDFSVTPYSLEKTTWNIEGRNKCFAEFEIVDGEYELTWISETPKNYDKFLEKFEEYQKNNEFAQMTETREVQAQQENNLASGEITKMSHTIFVVCFIVFVSLIWIVGRKYFKRKK